MEKIKLCSLFSGIGAFEKALKDMGIEFEITSYCEINKYSSCAYAAIHGVSEDLNLGDISNVKSEELPEFNLMTWGFPCFVGNTNVLTTNGYKKIKEVNIGDSVVVNSGNYKVLKTGVVDKNTIIVKTQGSLKTETTSNHPYFTREKSKKWNNKKRKYENVFTEPSWKNAGDLKKGDYVTIPKVMDTENYLYSLNNEELFIVGRYIADGHTAKNYKTSEGRPNDRNWQLILSIGSQKIDKFKEIIQETHFTCIKHTKSVYRAIFSNKKLVEIVEKECGCGAVNKTLSYNILSLPKEKLEVVVDGLMSGDGSCRNNTYRLTTVSRELAQALCLAIYKVYGTCGNISFTKRPSTCVIEGRTVNQRDTYTVAFKKVKSKQDKYQIVNNELWLPVYSVENTDETKPVYNLEVEEVHIYTANNIVVHNCQDISIAGNQAGIKVGTRSGLYYEGYRILKDRLPKYSIIENVKNLTQKGHKDKFDMIIDDLEKLGYRNYWKVLNAKDFGVPQNRERVFIVSILGEGSFEFPQGFDNGIRLKDVLENEVKEKYYLSNEYEKRFLGSLENIGNKKFPTTGDCKVIGTTVQKDAKGTNSRHWCYDTKSIIGCLSATDYKQPKQIVAPTIDTMQGGYRQPSIIIGGMQKNQAIKKDGICTCLTSSMGSGGGYVPMHNYAKDFRIRKLTPLECWRLMGFSDEDFYKAKVALLAKFYKGKDRASSQLYKMAGNSIVVDVLVAILDNLLCAKTEYRKDVAINVTPRYTQGELF